MSIETPEYEDWLKFSFVRNPRRRLYSAYKCTADRSSFSDHPHWIVRAERCMHQLGVQHTHDFKQFMDILFNILDKMADPHIKSQHQFIPNPAGQRIVNRLYYLEDFIRSMAEIRVLAGLVADTPIPPENRFQDHPEKYTTNYDDALIRRVDERYATDFQLFGYSTDFCPADRRPAQIPSDS